MHIDKRKAQKNQWRIPENNLMLIGVIGGSIGIWLGMQKARHKTKHMKFVIGIPVIVILQMIGAIFLIYY